MPSGAAIRKALLNGKPIPGLTGLLSNNLDTKMARASRAASNLSSDQLANRASNRQLEIIKLR